MNFFKKFGGSKLQEAAVLTGCAALLVISALGVSPGGTESIARTLSLGGSPESQTAGWVWVIFYSLYSSPNPIEHGGSSRIYWRANRGDFCYVWAPNGGVYRYWWLGGSHPTGALSGPATYTYYVQCFDTGPHNHGYSARYPVTVTVRPPCTPDNWTCGSWGACSGSQTRTCTNSGTCYNTPSPATSQSCTAACTSPENACGMTTQGTYLPNGVCGALAPPNSSCTSSCTSAPNICGQTGSGYHHVTTGVCNATVPPNSSCTSCTSASNACGATATGYMVGGVCNATTPSNSSCTPCTSAPNACGQTNSGIMVGASPPRSCNATPPPVSSCPQPVISFSAAPSSVISGNSSMLTWSVTNATVCALSSDSPSTFPSRSVALAGSVSTGGVTAPTTYTLSCQNAPGGPTASKSVRVVLTPAVEEI